MLVHAGGEWDPSPAFFGYNYLDFEMKHRDRQDSVPNHEQKKSIVMAWHEVFVLGWDVFVCYMCDGMFLFVGPSVMSETSCI